MTGGALIVSSGGRRKTVALADCIDAALEERAQADTIAWIKRLRQARVDGMPMRRRFTHRGDSLWWFTEIYLHKQQVILGLVRTVAAFEALIAREQPDALQITRPDRLTAVVAPQIARACGIALTGQVRPPTDWRIRMAALRTRARWLHTSALMSRARPREAPPAPRSPAIAAFVHRAFWRHARIAGGGMTSSGARHPDTHLHAEGSAEAYIGPVLEALETRLTHHRIAYVSLGPSENFSARRWWHPIRDARGAAAMPSIESLAPLERLAESRKVWSDRQQHLEALWRSDDLRASAVIRNVDCWPVVREELAGVALLQWPWSARAMDEAAAALDALQPAAALTYAEAGGWGRALMLECRRRAIPSAGLQHGFIYRHWLNYLHEEDEVRADPAHIADRGFPWPDRTLLFDDFARHHLATAGRFPPESLVVTGSPRLDALVAADRSLDFAAIAQARSSAGAGDGPLVLVVTKYREARRILPEFLDAAGAVGRVRVAIKTHPAETPDVYAQLLADRPHVTVLPAVTPLAPLLRAARAVVTLNSTVALDAAALGIPALVIGLPSNLSPFVEAGAMAGANPAEFRSALHRILYDQDFRQQLERDRAAFLSRFSIGSDGRAAERSADAVLELAGRPHLRSR